MAWHSGKPADDDFLSASVQYIRENFTELEPLQPYVDALLSSRIVEHNLDVSSPLNGYYVRWENGLQVCWWIGSSHTHPLAMGPIFRSDDIIWTYPASFVFTPVVVAGASNFGWASPRAPGLSFSRLISFAADASAREASINAVAIGRWE